MRTDLFDFELPPENIALRPAQPPIVQLHRLPVPGAPPTGAVRLDAPPSTRLLPHAGATQANPVSVPALRLDLPRQVPQPPPRPRGPSTAD